MLDLGTGTADFIPYLSVKPGTFTALPQSNLHLLTERWKKSALEFREWLGGEDAINTYCHKLAVDGGNRLAEVLGTKVMDDSGELTLNMVHPFSTLLTRPRC